MSEIKYSYDALEERYCDVRRIDAGKIEQLLKSGSVDICRETLLSFFEEIGFFGIKSMLMRLYVAMDIYIIVRTFSRELGIPNEMFVEKYGSIDDIEKNLVDFDGATEFFTKMLEQCVKWRVEFSRGNANEAINRAQDYIAENYVSEELSLKSVASFVNLSPTYLSALFKKETGMNFSDYLTKVRMEKAKELLCRTSKLVSEIAYEVGFNDYRYFGQLFKKYTGQTPREFQCSSNRVI